MHNALHQIHLSTLMIRDANVWLADIINKDIMQRPALLQVTNVRVLKRLGATGTDLKD